MNMNDNPTIGQLGALLATHDDDAGEHVIWVSAAGDVQVSLVEDDRNDVRLLYAPFEAGVGFVGVDAAADPDLLADLLSSLVARWHGAKGEPTGVIHIDLDDPESGAGWTMTGVATLDDALLATLETTRLH
jgi:hypothetical protein